MYFEEISLQILTKKTERCEKKEQILNLEIAKTQELFKQKLDIKI